MTSLVHPVSSPVAPISSRRNYRFRHLFNEFMVITKPLCRKIPKANNGRHNIVTTSLSAAERPWDRVVIIIVSMSSQPLIVILWDTFRISSLADVSQHVHFTKFPSQNLTFKSISHHTIRVIPVWCYDVWTQKRSPIIDRSWFLCVLYWWYSDRCSHNVRNTSGLVFCRLSKMYLSC